MILLPGIIFHELSHYIMCKLLFVRVKKVRLSHVEHYVPKSIIKSLLISIAPFLFSLIFAIIMLNYFFEGYYEILKFYLVYVVLYCSFPSKADTNFHKHHKILKKVVFYPLFLIFRFYYYISKSKYYKIIYSLCVIIVIHIIRILFQLGFFDQLFQFFN
jgi:hypothetical protein